MPTTQLHSCFPLLSILWTSLPMTFLSFYPHCYGMTLYGFLTAFVCFLLFFYPFSISVPLLHPRCSLPIALAPGPCLPRLYPFVLSPLMSLICSTDTCEKTLISS
ncbi:MAG: hypothetical protein J3R72DRAFT_102021 [Linnemannia gamsii]|nr:MAG: hypothetical protein J3R72DRAFT_102021 [Linnemannia gamsii]